MSEELTVETKKEDNQEAIKIQSGFPWLNLSYSLVIAPLSSVVIILIISLVVVVVNKFGGSSQTASEL